MWWITVALEAIDAGIQIVGQVLQNNALKRAGADAITQAEADTELGVLKADATYLEALANTAETKQTTEAQKAQLEANQKRLRTAAIIGAVALVLIIVIILTVKIRKS